VVFKEVNVRARGQTLIISEEVKVRVRALVTRVYSLAHLRVKFHLDWCGGGGIKTKGVFREGCSK
jgi:hypothetical protein